MVQDNQHFMGEGHDCFLLAATTGDAMVKGGEILVFGASNSPRHLLCGYFTYPFQKRTLMTAQPVL